MKEGAIAVDSTMFLIDQGSAVMNKSNKRWVEIGDRNGYFPPRIAPLARELWLLNMDFCSLTLVSGTIFLEFFDPLYLEEFLNLVAVRENSPKAPYHRLVSGTDEYDWVGDRWEFFTDVFDMTSCSHGEQEDTKDMKTEIVVMVTVGFPTSDLRYVIRKLEEANDGAAATG